MLFSQKKGMLNNGNVNRLIGLKLNIRESNWFTWNCYPYFNLNIKE